MAQETDEEWEAQPAASLASSLPSSDGLTDKQRAFLHAYLDQGEETYFNGTQSAITAGYSEHTAKQIATENLSKPAIKAYLDAYWEAEDMSIAEVKGRNSRLARSDMTDFISVDGNEEVPLVSINLFKAKRAKKLGLIKKCKTHTTRSYVEGQMTSEHTTVEVELYDAGTALERQARIKKMVGTEPRFVPEEPLTPEQAADLILAAHAKGVDKGIQESGGE